MITPISPIHPITGGQAELEALPVGACVLAQGSTCYYVYVKYCDTDQLFDQLFQPAEKNAAELAEYPLWLLPKCPLDDE